ncbi:hypothetical protein ACFU7Y_03495 [Kitasatospora sp. NPDC057542]|uniref:hypothetical protein n=1 Tax=Streptomycetaceae TaxID=2062 RepID=UPI001CCD0D18|nr:hypothetical protein [Streptomyces sp. LS1784]
MKYGFRRLSTVTGAVAAAILLASPAVAQGSTGSTARTDSTAPRLLSGHTADQKGSTGGNKHCERVQRGFSSDVVDFGDFSDTQFHLATDRQGEAFLNDSRNPGAWVDIDVIPGAPKCVIGTDLSATESGANIPNKLFLNVESEDGKIFQAVCNITGTPFSASNLAAACGPGFAQIPGTPV